MNQITKKLKNKFKPSQKAFIKAFKYWRNFDEEKAEQVLQKLKNIIKL